MAALSVNRVAQLIYSAWYKGETSTNLIAHSASLPIVSFVAVSDPQILVGQELKVTYTNITIDWKTHTYGHMDRYGKIQFLIKLNGWPTGQASIGYANSIDLMSTEARDHGQSSELMRALCNDVADEIISIPNLAKFVETKPTHQDMIAKEANKLYTQGEHAWHATTSKSKSASENFLEEIKKQQQTFDEYYSNIDAEMKAQYVKAKQEKFESVYNQPYKHKTWEAEVPLSQQAPKSQKWQGYAVQKRAEDLFPGLQTYVKCPNHACSYEGQLVMLIQHLNDQHNWARTAKEAKWGEPNLADWLEEWSARSGISLEMREDNVTDSNL